MNKICVMGGRALAVAIATGLFVSAPRAASACTTILVGKDASKTGRVLVAHNEDDAGPLIKRSALVPRDANRAATFWLEVKDPYWGGPFCADGFLNEHGVLVVSDNASPVAPAVTNGVNCPNPVGYEVRQTAAEQGKSARDAKDAILRLVAERGYVEPGRLYLVADPDEAWVVQVVKGRRAIARKCPDDGVAVIPNCYVFGRPEPGDTMTPELAAMAKADPDFDVIKVFQGEKRINCPTDFYRRRHGARLLGLEKELVFASRPAKKVDFADLIRVLSTHYEGTPDEVKSHHGALPICRAATALSLVCAFGATPPEHAIHLAWGPPCRTPFAVTRPFAGELPDGCLVGPEARERLDRHMKPEPGVGPGPRLEHLTVEHLVDPVGMDEAVPRFSWRAADVGSELQRTWRIVVTDEVGRTAWDSGVVSGGNSTLVPYAGTALKPFTRYGWRVVANYGESDVASCENAWFETGFLGGEWTRSKWISAASGQGAFRPPMRLARAFAVAKPLKRARLFATALGLYAPFVNGVRATKDRMLPGWTSYAHHVPYEAFDVTPLVKPGANALAALVGDGWFAGCISRVAKPAGTFGHGRETPLFRAELRLEYADGTVETIGTDGTWRSFYLNPAMLSSDIYQGESYDAAIDDASWKLPGFEKLAYCGDVSVEDYPAAIVWHDGARVGVRRTIRPVSVKRRPGNVWQLDFGENVAGVERITLKKAYPGAVITVRHGEALDADGDLWRGNLAFAQATTTLACGKEPLVYAPSFTFYGFRYAEISGWPEDALDPDAVVLEVLSSTGAPTASFRCSDELLNRFVANVRRSQEANFIDVPTDCPQRCERFGWTGDAQIFAETAMTCYDVAAFFTKWNRDLQNDFRRDGSYAEITPWPRNPAEEATVVAGTAKRHHPSAGWADVGVVIPWTCFRVYGDRRILEKSYPNMLAYARSYDEPGASTIGDWLNVDDPTDKAFVIDAMAVRTTTLVRHAAAALGRADDVRDLDARLAKRRAAIAARWFTADGALKEKSQTAAAMTLVYDLAPNKAAAKKAGEELVRRIEAKGGHLSTGFLGTPVLLDALTRAGEAEAAYKLLRTTTFPSWLHPVTQGATTVWERWDAIKDGKFHKDWMNSLNHYAYGSVVSWLYGTVCGIQCPVEENPDAAGFRRIRLAPLPGGGLTEAAASFDAPCGTIRSAWKTENGKTTYRFTVPANTMAEIVLPGRKPQIVHPGDYAF